MEPQIIDYYNELPQSVNVIDKLNEEYDELQSKYEYIKSITDRYIAPFQIAKTYDEYKKYEKILDKELSEKFKEILKDVEYGILAICNIDKYPANVYHTVNHNSWVYICHAWDKDKSPDPDQEWFKGKLINELDNITKNKNRKWCEDRIDLALEICLSKYESINDENNEEIIDDLIHHILNDKNCDYLTKFYIENIDFYTNDKYESSLPFCSISCLNCYHCEKCGILASYMEEGITMRCQDCLYI